MQSIKKKSETSLKIANLLVENGHYSHSVHSFYYACLQLMIVSYCKKNGINKQGDYDAVAPETNTHNWLANRIFALLWECKGLTPTQKRDLQTDFRFLIDKVKDERVEADYKEKVFTQDDIELPDGIRDNTNKIIDILTTRLLQR